MQQHIYNSRNEQIILIFKFNFHTRILSHLQGNKATDKPHLVPLSNLHKDGTNKKEELTIHSAVSSEIAVGMLVAQEPCT